MGLIIKGAEMNEKKGVIIPLSTGGNPRYYQCWTRFPLERFIQRCQRRGIKVTVGGRWSRRNTSPGYGESYFQAFVS